jgi:hypothetical protein
LQQDFDKEKKKERKEENPENEQPATSINYQAISMPISSEWDPSFN